MDLNSQFTTFLIAFVIFLAAVCLSYFTVSPGVERMEELDKKDQA